MSPNTNNIDKELVERYEEPTKEKFKADIVWFNVFVFALIHLGFLYSICVAPSIYLKTWVFCYVYGVFGGLGITAGAHRLWSHRCYKAKLPLRALLCVFAFIAGQNSIYEWSRDHRVHHKFTETEADPHNIKRGFFFAHMGWLMCKKHPDVITKGKTVSMQDVWDDPVVRFNKRFYYPMFLLFSFIIPIAIPVYLWNETVWCSFLACGMFKYCVSLNMTWTVNSLAHAFGDKPFDKYIEARENRLVSLFAQGEGWHNYHHVFPWDYAASELGYSFNITKMFIDLMAYFGLAYDLKTTHPEMIKSRKIKYGDGNRIESVK